MKKAVICGEREATLVDAPDPKPKGDYALVKVHAAPLCTEYKAYMAGGRHEFLGHEAAGEVVAADDAGSVAVGDRVVVMPLYACGACPLCRAGDYIHCERMHDFEAIHGSQEGTATLAQYLLKPPWLLMPIPDGVSYEHASLACCAFGPSFGAFDRIGLAADETVLITGAGPVGLGAVVNARFIGARALVVEPFPWRREKAMELGAEAVFGPAQDDLIARIREHTEHNGVDAALDCSGTVGGQRTCLEATRRRGRVAFVGECSEDLTLRVSPDLLRTGLTVVGSWHYNANLFPAVMRVIQESRLLDSLISHVLPLAEIQQAFELCAAGKSAKIILKPWERGGGVRSPTEAAGRQAP